MACLITLVSQDKLCSRMVTHKNTNSKAKPRDTHKSRENKAQAVLGKTCIPKNGARSAMGRENSIKLGTHSPIV